MIGYGLAGADKPGTFGTRRILRSVPIQCIVGDPLFADPFCKGGGVGPLPDGGSGRQPRRQSELPGGLGRLLRRLGQRGARGDAVPRRQAARDGVSVAPGTTAAFAWRASTRAPTGGKTSSCRERRPRRSSAVMRSRVGERADGAGSARRRRSRRRARHLARRSGGTGSGREGWILADVSCRVRFDGVRGRRGTRRSLRRRVRRRPHVRAR